MPGRLGKCCAEYGCPEMVTEHDQSRCAKHRKEQPTHGFGRKYKPRDPFYNTSVWIRCRRAKLVRNPMCEVCERAVATEVHHIKPRAQFPELSLVLSNLRSECRSCHARESQREAKEATKK